MTQNRMMNSIRGGPRDQTRVSDKPGVFTKFRKCSSHLKKVAREGWLRGAKILS